MYRMISSFLVLTVRLNKKTTSDIPSSASSEVTEYVEKVKLCLGSIATLWNPDNISGARDEFFCRLLHVLEISRRIISDSMEIHGCRETYESRHGQFTGEYYGRRWENSWWKILLESWRRFTDASLFGRCPSKGVFLVNGRMTKIQILLSPDDIRSEAWSSMSRNTHMGAKYWWENENPHARELLLLTIKNTNRKYAKESWIGPVMSCILASPTIVVVHTDSERSSGRGPRATQRWTKLQTLRIKKMLPGTWRRETDAWTSCIWQGLHLCLHCDFHTHIASDPKNLQDSGSKDSDY